MSFVISMHSKRKCKRTNTNEGKSKWERKNRNFKRVCRNNKAIQYDSFIQHILNKVSRDRKGGKLNAIKDWDCQLFPFALSLAIDHRLRSTKHARNLCLSVCPLVRRRSSRNGKSSRVGRRNVFIFFSSGTHSSRYFFIPSMSFCYYPFYDCAENFQRSAEQEESRWTFLE